MKIGSGSNYGSSSLGYPITSRQTKLSAHKNGYTPLKSTPRGYLSNIGGTGGGSDKESLSSRSRKGKLRKPLITSNVPLYKKRNLDFTDYAYREAVGRLKYLLAESYTPTKLSSTFYHKHFDDSGEDTDNQSVIERPVLSEISKYIPSNSNLSRYNSLRRLNYPTYKDYLLNPTPITTTNLQQTSGETGSGIYLNRTNMSKNFLTAPQPQIQVTTEPPPELLNFIEKQEGYIEQLERESQYCRGELSSLLSKVKDVISENETLTDQAKSGINRSTFQQETSESEETDPDYRRPTKIKKVPLEGPNIVFESRISELEAQLAQAEIDFRRLAEENQNNKRKMGIVGENAGTADAYKKQIDNLQRDKQTLEESVRKLQGTITQMKDSDVNNFTKTQRNRDLAEQATFERTQSDLEIRRLKEELERQHERMRELQHEMAKRVAEERSSAERRYNYQVDQLGGDLSSQWEQSSKLQLELERQKRIETDFKRELGQKNSQIDELKTEIKNKTASLLSDVAQVNAEKQSLEQEITSLRLQLERAERQSKAESSRLNAEIGSLRQRLDRADADLLHSRRENLRLADQISTLEKEIALGDLNREPRPKEMSRLMADMETKHATTVTELEDMITDQRKLTEKLTSECKILTEKLEDTSLKHKDDRKKLKQTNNELMERLKQIWTSYKDISPIYSNLNSSNQGTSDNDSISSQNIKHNQSTIKHTMDDLNQETTIQLAHQIEAQQFQTLQHQQKQQHQQQQQHQELLKKQKLITEMMMSSIHQQTLPNQNQEQLNDSIQKNKSTKEQSLAKNINIKKKEMNKLKEDYQAHQKLPNVKKKESMRQLVVEMKNKSKDQKIPTIPKWSTILIPNTMTDDINIQPERTQNMIQTPTISSTNQTLDTNIKEISSSMKRPLCMITGNNNIQKDMNNRDMIPSTINNTTQMFNNIQSNKEVKLEDMMMEITQEEIQNLNKNQISQSQQIQDILNRSRAKEIWGIHLPEELELENPSSNHQQNLQNYCQNSHPRQKFHYNQLDYQNKQIDLPELTISSPSLFETSPDTSPTLSPTLTVLQL